MNKQDSLIFKFFKLFSAFEYELKSRGYVLGSNKKVSADWDRFVKEKIDTNFLTTLGDKAISAEYLLKYPPKKQVLDENDNLIWDEVDCGQNKHALFDYIKRVRNNLFHGAKLNYSYKEIDEERDVKLLNHSYVILEFFQREI